MKSLMSFTVDRRRLIAGLALAPLAGVLTTACNVTSRAARANQGPLYSALFVDVEPVRAKGINGYADKIARYQKQGLAEAYQGALAPGKGLPTLTAEIHSISFGGEMESFPIMMGQSGSAFPQHVYVTDWLEGFAVIKKGGQEIKRVKILAAHRTEGRRQWSMADDEQRLIELTRYFAEQLRGDLGD